jgi:predicted AlkP superfamily pyrophosphatase or phosphodiesterase
MRRLRVLVLAMVIMLLAANAPAWGHGGKSEPPKRVLVLVLDQLRPDYVDKFDMRNVKALMRRGASFDNAYLGHMASETVISHNVITSGKLPRNMGWSDEVYRDVDNVLGGGAGACGSRDRCPASSSTC